jgi:hypothetical protein
MRLLKKSASENSGGLVGTLVSVALFSAGTALWFSRSYSLNAFDNAWGDPNFYSNLRFFLWGAVVSLVVLLLVVAFAAVRWRRIRLAVMSAIAICGTLMLVSTWSDRQVAQITAAPLLPGAFVGMMAFGVHSSPGKWVGFLWVLGINVALYATIIAGVSAFLGRQRRGKELTAKR